MLVAKEINFQALEESMKSLEQVECPVKHHFSYGVYTRETFMPKGSVVLGKKHKHSTTNIVLQGKVRLYDKETNRTTLIEAPFVFVSSPGVQKVAYFLEDTIWINTHPTEETDLDKIESLFIDNTKETICLG